MVILWPRYPLQPPLFEVAFHGKWQPEAGADARTLDGGNGVKLKAVPTAVQKVASRGVRVKHLTTANNLRQDRELNERKSNAELRYQIPLKRAFACTAQIVNV
jgi:hypothetical protein